MHGTEHSGDHLLLAVAESASALLGARRVVEALPEVLAIVGAAAEADRTYVHQVRPHPATGVPAITEIAGWISPEVLPQRHRPPVTDAPLSQLPSWLEPLSRNEVVQGVAREFPTLERAVMEHFGTVSVLAVPVFVNGELGGTIGLDDCRRERRWESRQISALKALAATLGALWERERASDRATASEAKLRATIEQDAHVTAALAQFGRESIRAQHDPDLPDVLCGHAASLLHCDSVYGLLWREDEQSYVLSGTYGLEAAVTDVGRTVRIPRDRVDLDSMFGDDDVIEVAPSLLPLARAPRTGGGRALLVALRHGRELLGVLSASRAATDATFSESDRRVARGIAHLTSLSLENARLLYEQASANRLKSEFVATMSHELRTPLGVILGYTDMLEAGELGSLTGEQRDALARVKRSARTLVDIIGATLDLGRIEAGREQVRPGSVDVGELLARIRGALDLDERARVEVDPMLGTVRTDEAKLEVILRNLVGNAAKFCPDGCIRLSAHAAGDGVEIVVRDDGIGIREAERGAIFEAFRQGGGHALGGVGLGLHIVLRLTQLLEGEVDVESEVGRGSTFVVRLPNLPGS